MPRVRNKSKIEIQVFNVKYSLTFICLLCLLMIKTEKLKLFSLHDIRQAEHYLKSLVGCISVARLDVGQYTHMIPLWNQRHMYHAQISWLSFQSYFEEVLINCGSPLSTDRRSRVSQYSTLRNRVDRRHLTLSREKNAGLNIAENSKFRGSADYNTTERKLSMLIWTC